MVQFRLVLYFVPEKDAKIQRMVCLLPLLSAGKRAHTDSDIETRKKGAKCALFACFGAAGRTRTGTSSRTTDFESVTSANFITAANIKSSLKFNIFMGIWQVKYASCP